MAFSSPGNLHVVWNDNTPGNSEIFYKKSTDGGATWSADQRLTWSSGDSSHPAIAVDSFGHIHLFWFDNTPGNYEIYYKKSADGGATWASNRRITWTPGTSERPDIAVDPSDNFHVVWQDNAPGNMEIYYVNSTDGGATLTRRQRLTWTAGESEMATALASDGTVHVVWYDDTSGNREIYHKKTMDLGESWTKSRRLTWNSGQSYCPSMSADSSGGLHLVWVDSSPGNFEIYYRKTTDGGTNWSVAQRLTWNIGDSDIPAIAVDPSDNLHVVWIDSTPGNLEIYYRKFMK